MSVAVCAIGALASRASAQDTTAKANVDRQCDSVVAASRADTVTMGLFLSVKRVDGGVLLDEQVTEILAIVASGFTPPAPFRLTVFSGPVAMPGLRRMAQSGGPVLRPPTVTGAYRASVAPNGVLLSVQVIRASLMPGFDSAATKAIETAGEIKGLFAPRDGTLSATVDVRFSSDSVAGPGWVTRRLFTARFPRMPLIDAVPRPDTTVVQVSQEARREGGPTETVLRFVVDRTGEPIMETMEIVRGTSLEFVRSALAVLSKKRFVPARINGCSVAQTIEFPFALPPQSSNGASPPKQRLERH